MPTNEKSWEWMQERGEAISFIPPSALTEPIAKEPIAPEVQPLSPSLWAVGRKMAQPFSSQPPLPGLTSFLHPAEMKTRNNYKLPTLSLHSEFLFPFSHSGPSLTHPCHSNTTLTRWHCSVCWQVLALRTRVWPIHHLSHLAQCLAFRSWSVNVWTLKEQREQGSQFHSTPGWQM